MAQNRALLTFVDGSTQEIKLTPKATIAAERKFGATLGDHGAEATYYMGWFVLGMPGGTNGFDSWLDTVEGVEPLEEADPIPPAEATPAEDYSPISPPSPPTSD